jgi:PTS system mannose-specific IID component
MGLTWALIPIIKKLYPKKEDQIAAMRRHMQFFNTEPFHIGIAIPGIVAALEEQKASGENISDEDINAVKIGLMGPLAGIGDSWFQGLVFPILWSLGAGMAVEGNILGPILWVVGFYLQMVGIGYNVFKMGYAQGKTAVSNILGSEKFKAAFEALGILGLLVVGALGANSVKAALNINFTVGQTPISIQGFVDSLLPGLIPLAVILGVYQLIRRKVNPVVVILIIFLVGIVGGYFGFLTAG